MFSTFVMVPLAWAVYTATNKVSQFEAKKKESFFNGEVFFLLTSPLMDDPMTTTK